MPEFKIGLSTGPSVLECSHLEKGKDAGGTHKGECVPIGKFLIQAVLSCDIVNVCDRQWMLGKMARVRVP